MHDASSPRNSKLERALRRLRGVPGVLLVALLTAFACAPSLWNAFPYDDGTIAGSVSEAGRKNPMVSELRPVADYFTTEYWTGSGVESLHSNPLYRPVTVWSFAVTHLIAPGDGTPESEARPHHVLNLLLHVANLLLVFFVTRHLMGRESFGPVGAAAVFGLSAVHAEAVAAIVGRADLFAFGFGMAALWCVLAARLARSMPRAIAVGAGAVLLWLAFCSKESALAWWPILGCGVIAAAWQRGAFAWRELWLPIGLGVVPVTIWFLLRQNAFEGLSDPYPVAYASNPLRDLESMPRVVAAILIWGFSLLKTVVPYPLASDYGASVFAFAAADGRPSALDWLYLLPLTGVFIVGVIACRRRTRHPMLFLGAAAWLGLGFITSNIAVVIGTIWAERLAYLPSLGFAFFAAWCLDRRVGGRVGVWLLVAYLAASSSILFTRVGDWRDSETLFAKDVRTQPRSLTLRLQAAIQELRRGNTAGWRAMLEAAIEVEPEFARAYIELGAGVFQSAQRRDAGVLDESERWLRRALEARILEPSEETMLWRNLAVLALQRDRMDAALPWLEKVLAHDPFDVLSRHQILVDMSRAFPDETFLRILGDGERAVPGHPAWGLHHGLRSARLGEFVDARRRLETALPRVEFLDVTVQNAWLILAQLRAKAGDGRGARELFGHIASDPRFDESIRRAAAGSK